MKIRVRVAGFILGKAINQGFDQEVDGETSVAGLFRAMDKQKRVGRGFFAGLMKMTNPPSILLNGDRIVLSEDSGKPLKEGDEIAIVSPIAGG